MQRKSMIKQRWKAGIVGCGKIAGGWERPRADGPVETHAQAYHRHPDFRIMAAVDSDAEVLANFQNTWRVANGYQSIAAMCDELELDVVSVCSPDVLHFEHVSSIISSPSPPKIVFVEKPVCLLEDDLEVLVDLAKAAEVSVIVDHTRRFDPAHARLANTIRSGLLGNLVQGTWTYYGGWLHNGTHAVDTLGFLTGERLDVVSAEIAGYTRPDDPDLNVTLAIGNATVIVEAFDEDIYQLFQGELRFEKGLVRLIDFGRRIEIEVLDVNQLGERVLKLLPSSAASGLSNPLAHAIDALGAHLAGSSQLAEIGVDLTGASETMRVMWLAQRLALPMEVSTNA